MGLLERTIAAIESINLPQAGRTTRRGFFGLLAAGGGAVVWGKEAAAFHTEAKQRPGQAAPPQEPIDHPSLTRRIAYLYGREFPDSQTARDMQDPEFLEAFIQGSIDEDYPLTKSLQHAWNPTRPEKDDCWNPFLGLGNDGSKDAFSRAQGLWEEARKYYKSGERRRAYYTLGHVIHLLEDMGSPAHAFLIPHFTIQKIVTEREIIDNQSEITKYLKDRGLDLTGQNEVVVIDIGDDYETICASIEMGSIISRPLHKKETASLYEAMRTIAMLSLNPGEEIAHVIGKLYSATRSGNGHYTGNRATEKDIRTLARVIVPEVIERGAGVLGLWDGAIKGAEEGWKRDLIRTTQEYFDRIGWIYGYDDWVGDEFKKDRIWLKEQVDASIAPEARGRLSVVMFHTSGGRKQNPDYYETEVSVRRAKIVGENVEVQCGYSSRWAGGTVYRDKLQIDWEFVWHNNGDGWKIVDIKISKYDLKTMDYEGYKNSFDFLWKRQE